MSETEKMPVMLVEQRVRMRRRVDAHRHADEHCQQEAREGQDDRMWQRGEHERRDLLVAREVDAEVALQQRR